tara:strand:+ start:620 stop:802 length:183 start_codon:yes stop_codon:yes gene_type:complete
MTILKLPFVSPARRIYPKRCSKRGIDLCVVALYVGKKSGSNQRAEEMMHTDYGKFIEKLN